MAVASVEYVPATHCVHTIFASSSHSPTAQNPQPISLDTPVPTPGVPAGHDTHVDTDVAPTAVEYVPATQSVHVSVDPLDHDPASQLVHAVDPANAENVPALHLLHPLDDDAPAFDEYDPDAHCKHTSDDAAPMLDEYVPAAQSRHTCVLLAPMLLEYVPAPHCVHAVDPLPPAYVPVPHALHVPALAPDHEPASHSTQPVDPADEYVPALQPTHTLLPAPTTVENVPALHSVHVVDDDAPTLTE